MFHAERRLGPTLAAMAVLALAAVRCGSGVPTEPDAGPGDTICSNNSDCAAGFVCYGAVCAPECKSNADCASGECNFASGVCEAVAPPNDGGPVVDGPDAGPVDGPDAGPDAPDAGGPGPGTACTTKYDCGAGLICKGNPRVCQVPRADNSCSADLDCPSGKICNFSKQCEPGCASVQDCTAPELCHPQKFICEKCSLTNPCPAGNSCIGESCVPATECTSTETCAAALPGSVCKGTAPNRKCGNCESHSDCREAPYASENRVCSSAGICEEVNCSDADCREEMASELGYCDTAEDICKVRECLQDSDCATNPNGSICNTSTNTCTSGGASCDGADRTACETECAEGDEGDPTATPPIPARPAGLACNYATCSCSGASGPGGDGDPCVVDADCQTNYTCGLGICSPAAVDPFTGGPCEPIPLLCGLCVNAVTGAACDVIGCSLTALFGSVICL